MHQRRACSRWVMTVALLTLLATGESTHAQRHGLDRFDEKEDRGIFSRANQKRVDTLILTTMVGTALWQGSDTKLGLASWQAMDATVTAAMTTEVMKNVFQRPRPAEDPHPTQWFAGSGHKSFPSGEVAMAAAFVTPYIYAYHQERPAVWAMAALPLYMAEARMGSQAHWLTDVIAGAAIGAGAGYLASQRETPLLLMYTGKGVFVGWRTRF